METQSASGKTESLPTYELTGMDDLHRLVHQKLSFWTAKENCQSLGGALLELTNAGEVMEALGDSMVGNVGQDFRIDGWTEEKWYEGTENATLAVNARQDVTLTLNLEDGSVSGDHEVESRLGSVCQGADGVGKGSKGCDYSEKVEEQAEQSTSTTQSSVASTSEVETWNAPRNFRDASPTTFYYINRFHMTKEEAEEKCAMLGGHGLAKIFTLQERNSTFGESRNGGSKESRSTKACYATGVGISLAAADIISVVLLWLHAGNHDSLLV